MKPFNQIINTWNGKEFYRQEKRELLSQIRYLISINSGLAQPCHCETEEQHRRCKEHDNELKIKVEKYKKSIMTALGI